MMAEADFADTSVALRSDPHDWTLDLAQSHGGPGEDLDPVGALLGALCGCLLMSLRFTAELRKLSIDGATASARTDPKGYLKTIAVELGIESTETDDVVDEAVERAERGCYVRAALGDHVDVDLTWHRVISG